MSKQRILVIEDDSAIRRGVVDALEFEGYMTIDEPRGDSGLERALKADYHLLLLDLILPGCDGMDVLREVKAERPTLPVIILTARGEEADRVRGLRLGADDYVVKPFSVVELLARVEAVLRRSPERPSEVVQLPVPGGVVHMDRREVLFDDGERVELSEREIEILSYLCGHAGRAISRDELLTRVWHIDPRGVQSRTIDMHIARLREKLRDNSSSPRIIVTVRGKGYSYAQSEPVS